LQLSGFDGNACITRLDSEPRWWPSLVGQVKKRGVYTDGHFEFRFYGSMQLAVTRQNLDLVLGASFVDY